MASGPILLCYDGSEPARSAIRTAAYLVGGGQATVLTVWEPFEPSLLHPVSDTVAVMSGIAKELDEAGVKVAFETAGEGTVLANEAGFEAKPLVRRGRPREAILEVAHEIGARAIVLGSRGVGGAESVLFGSVSTAVLHHCRDIPLIVVPGVP